MKKYLLYLGINSEGIHKYAQLDSLEINDGVSMTYKPAFGHSRKPYGEKITM